MDSCRTRQARDRRLAGQANPAVAGNQGRGAARRARSAPTRRPARRPGRSPQAARPGRGSAAGAAHRGIRTAPDSAIAQCVVQDAYGRGIHEHVIGQRTDGLVLQELCTAIILRAARRCHLDDDHRIDQRPQAVDGGEFRTAEPRHQRITVFDTCRVTNGPCTLPACAHGIAARDNARGKQWPALPSTPRGSPSAWSPPVYLRSRRRRSPRRPAATSSPRTTSRPKSKRPGTT